MYNLDIRVLGIGGGGSNTADFIIKSNLKGIKTYSINTDAQALDQSQASTRIHIGKTLTKGLGAGAIPEIGRNAAEESREELIECIDGADIVFVASGMGGGTGTGAAPYIASLAKELGILTIAIVTKPFSLEGRTRMEKAIEGISKLNDIADITVVIPNQKIIEEHEDKFLEEAFTIPDEVLKVAVESLIRMLDSNAQVGMSIDLNALIATLANRGLAVMGIGESANPEINVEENLHQALELATTSKILDVSIKGAKQFIVLIGGDIETITMYEEDQIIQYLKTKLGYDDIQVIVAYRDEEEAEEYERSITIIATGYVGNSSDGILETEY
ncbi:cell division protein FtsZ [Anaerorhabdus sp.]|uniref:cell division protein FtsZ n=1 Tax=Anaerorhabdus sp. TaxID=1872524 RepID=UPI003A875C88